MDSADRVFLAYQAGVVGTAAATALLLFYAPRPVVGIVIACVSAVISWNFFTTLAAPPQQGDTDLAVMGFIKFVCEVPLGLGSIVAFGCFPERWRRGWGKRAFVFYVNAAVLGNIAMMVAVPTGGTMRGWSSRVTCLALTAFLAASMARCQWRTVDTEKESDGWFVFRASPMTWIVLHACYRALLVTLPAFQGARYVLLEALSLTLMFAARWRWARGNAGGWATTAKYFGIADTMTVASMSIVTQVADAVVGSEFRIVLPNSFRNSDVVADLASEETGALDTTAVLAHGAITLLAIRYALQQRVR